MAGEVAEYYIGYKRPDTSMTMIKSFLECRVIGNELDALIRKQVIG